MVAEEGVSLAAGKKTNVVLWSGLAAAAAGVIAVAVMAKLKQRSYAEGAVQNRLRDVQDVLSDCYKKISEIEAHLPVLLENDAKNNRYRLSSQISGQTS